jgi:hypothetical protein
MFLGVEVLELDGLIESKSCVFIDGVGIDALKGETVFGTNDEEGVLCVNGIETFKIKVASIHDVDSVGFIDEIVQEIDIMSFCLGDEEKGRDVSLKIELSVDFDGRLLEFKVCPFESSKAEINDRGIESVDGVIKFDGEIVVFFVESSSFVNEMLCEVSPYAPVTGLIGTRESRKREIFGAKSQMIQLIFVCVQAGNDTTKALEPGKLTKHEGEELIATRELANAFVSLVFVNKGIELVGTDEICDLRENVAIFIHGEGEENDKETYQFSPSTLKS